MTPETPSENLKHRIEERALVDRFIYEQLHHHRFGKVSYLRAIQQALLNVSVAYEAQKREHAKLLAEWPP